MILFKGKDNQLIELQILNYEFPEISNGPDANWLEVYSAAEFRVIKSEVDNDNSRPPI
jgi:hypothetical protein